MKRVIILTAAILLVASSMGFATLTRTLTMGNVNGIVHDEGNIWLFPQTLYDYPGLVIGEFFENGGEGSSDEFTDMGINYKFGEKKPFVLGMYFTKQQPLEIPNYPFDWDFNIQDNKRMDLFYSRMIGGSKFGFHFNYVYGSTSYDNDSTEFLSLNKEKESIRNFGFDFGLTPNNGNLDLTAGISFLSWKDQNFRGKDETKPDGNLNVRFLARYFHVVDQKTTWIPYAGVMYEKIGIKLFGQGTPLDTAYQTNTQKFFTGVIGVGLNYTPSAGVLAVGDVGLMLDNSHYKVAPADTADNIIENKYDYATIPYFRIGIDATVLSWVDLRAGAESFWDNYKQDYVQSPHSPYTSKFRESYVSNSTFLGAGLHWGNFFADLYVDPMLITDGPYFLSGNSTDWAFQVSLKYKMF